MQRKQIFLLILAALVLAWVVACDSGSPTAGQDEDNEAVTMAVEYGLLKSQVASFDRELCARLIRFGQVAMDRGRYTEAKRFFWKALLVDPTSKLAWRYYDQAVLHTLSQQSNEYPGLLGLPGLSDQPGDAPVEEHVEEEGC